MKKYQGCSLARKQHRGRLKSKLLHMQKVIPLERVYIPVPADECVPLERLRIIQRLAKDSTVFRFASLLTSKV